MLFIGGGRRERIGVRKGLDTPRCETTFVIQFSTDLYDHREIRFG